MQRIYFPQTKYAIKYAMWLLISYFCPDVVISAINIQALYLHFISRREQGIWGLQGLQVYGICTAIEIVLTIGLSRLEAFFLPCPGTRCNCTCFKITYLAAPRCYLN